jgi:hypothetical protein
MHILGKNTILHQQLLDNRGPITFLFSHTDMYKVIVLIVIGSLSFAFISNTRFYELYIVESNNTQYHKNNVQRCVSRE